MTTAFSPSGQDGGPHSYMRAVSSMTIWSVHDGGTAASPP